MAYIDDPSPTIPTTGRSGLPIRSPTDPETSTSGQYTFYGRYVNWTAADNREPLATSFAARFATGGTFSGGTNVIAWRDSKVNQGAFTCPVVPGVRPAWYPLGQEGLFVSRTADTGCIGASRVRSPSRVSTDPTYRGRAFARSITCIAMTAVTV